MSIVTLLVTDEARCGGLTIDFLYPELRSRSSSGAKVDDAKVALGLTAFSRLKLHGSGPSTAAQTNGDADEGLTAQVNEFEGVLELMSQDFDVVHPFEWDKNTYPCPECLSPSTRPEAAALVETAVQQCAAAAVAVVAPNQDWENVRFTSWALHETLLKVYKIVETEASPAYDRRDAILNGVGRLAAVALFNVGVAWVLRSARQHHVSVATTVRRWREAAGVFDMLLTLPLGKNTLTPELSPDYIRLLSLVSLSAASEAAMQFFLPDTQHLHDTVLNLCHQAAFFYAVALQITEHSGSLPATHPPKAWCNFLKIKVDFLTGFTWYISSLEPGTKYGDSRRRKAAPYFEAALEAIHDFPQANARSIVAAEISTYLQRAKNFRAMKATTASVNGDESYAVVTHVDAPIPEAVKNAVPFRNIALQDTFATPPLDAKEVRTPLRPTEALLRSRSKITASTEQERRCAEILSGRYATADAHVTVDVSMIQQDLRSLPPRFVVGDDSNGVPCQIIQVAVSLNAPTSSPSLISGAEARQPSAVILIVDLNDVDRERQEKLRNALLSVFKSPPCGSWTHRDKIAVMEFDSIDGTPVTPVSFIDPSTDDGMRTLVNRTLRQKGRGRFANSSGTPLVEAVREAAKALQRLSGDDACYRGNLHVLVASNGGDRTAYSDASDWAQWGGDRTAADHVAAILKATHVQVHTAAIGLGADDALLGAIAEASAGTAVRAVPQHATSAGVSEVDAMYAATLQRWGTALLTAVSTRIGCHLTLAFDAPPVSSNASDASYPPIRVLAVESDAPLSLPATLIVPSTAKSADSKKTRRGTANRKMSVLLEAHESDAAVPPPRNSTDPTSSNPQSAPQRTSKPQIALVAPPLTSQMDHVLAPYINLGETTTVLVSLAVPSSQMDQDVVFLGNLRISYERGGCSSTASALCTLQQPLIHVNNVRLEDEAQHSWLPQATVHQFFGRSAIVVGSSEQRFSVRGHEALTVGNGIITGPAAALSITTPCGIRVDLAADSEVRLDEVHRHRVAVHLCRGTVHVTTPAGKTAYVTSNGYRAVVTGSSRFHMTYREFELTAKTVVGRAWVSRCATAATNAPPALSSLTAMTSGSTPFTNVLSVPDFMKKTTSPSPSTQTLEPQHEEAGNTVELLMSRQTRARHTPGANFGGILEVPWLMSLADEERALIIALRSTSASIARRHASFTRKHRKQQAQVGGIGRGLVVGPPPSDLPLATNDEGAEDDNGDAMSHTATVTFESNMQLLSQIVLHTHRSRLELVELVERLREKLARMLQLFTRDQRVLTRRSRHFIMHYVVTSVRTQLSNSIAYITENVLLDSWRQAMEVAARKILLRAPACRQDPQLFTNDSSSRNPLVGVDSSSGDDGISSAGTEAVSGHNKSHGPTEVPLTWCDVFEVDQLLRALRNQRPFAVTLGYDRTSNGALLFSPPPLADALRRLEAVGVQQERQATMKQMQWTEQVMTRQSEEHRREVALVRLFECLQWDGFDHVLVQDILSVFAALPDSKLFAALWERAKALFGAVGLRKTVNDTQFATVMTSILADVSPAEFTVTVETLARRAQLALDLRESCPLARGLARFLRALAVDGAGHMSIAQATEFMQRFLTNRYSSAAMNPGEGLLSDDQLRQKIEMWWDSAAFSTTARRHGSALAQEIIHSLIRKRSTATLLARPKSASVAASIALPTSSIRVQKMSTSTADTDVFIAAPPAAAPKEQQATPSVFSLAPDAAEADGDSGEASAAFLQKPLSLSLVILAAFLDVFRDLVVPTHGEQFAMEKLEAMFQYADVQRDAKRARSFQQLMQRDAISAEIQHVRSWEIRHALDGADRKARDAARSSAFENLLPDHLESPLHILVAPLCIFLGYADPLPMPRKSAFGGDETTGGLGMSIMSTAAQRGSGSRVPSIGTSMFGTSHLSQTQSPAHDGSNGEAGTATPPSPFLDVVSGTAVVNGGHPGLLEVLHIPHGASPDTMSNASPTTGGGGKNFWSTVVVPQLTEEAFPEFRRRLMHFSPLCISHRTLLYTAKYLALADLDPEMLSAINPVLGGIAKWTLLMLKLALLTVKPPIAMEDAAGVSESISMETSVGVQAATRKLLRFSQSRSLGVDLEPSATIATVAASLRGATSNSVASAASGASVLASSTRSNPNRSVSASPVRDAAGNVSTTSAPGGVTLLTPSRPTSARSAARTFVEVTSPRAPGSTSSLAAIASASAATTVSVSHLPPSVSRFSSTTPRPPTFSQRLNLRPNSAGTTRRGFIENNILSPTDGKDGARRPPGASELRPGAGGTVLQAWQSIGLHHQETVNWIPSDFAEVAERDLQRPVVTKTVTRPQSAYVRSAQANKTFDTNVSGGVGGGSSTGGDESVRLAGTMSMRSGKRPSVVSAHHFYGDNSPRSPTAGGFRGAASVRSQGPPSPFTSSR